MNRKLVLFLAFVVSAGLMTFRTVRAGIEVKSGAPSIPAEPGKGNPSSVLPYILRAEKATVWRMGIVENPDPERASRSYKLGSAVVLSEEQLRRLQTELARPENL